MIFLIQNLEGKNQVFCDQKAIISLRFDIVETSGVVLKIE